MKNDFNLSSRLKDELLEGYIRLRAVVDSKGGQIKDYEIVDLNRRAEVLLGVSRQAIIGDTICQVFDTLEKCWDDLHETWKASQDGYFEYFFKGINRGFLINPVQLSQHEYLFFFLDTTDAHTVEEILPVHEVLFENAQDIILYTNIEGRIINANQKACAAYGYTKEELLEKTIQKIRHPSTLVDYEKQMRKAAAGGVLFESMHLRADGSKFQVEVSARTTVTSGGELRIHIIRDITERKQQEEKIAWLARHDSLTGILNRASFLQRLYLELERARDNKTGLAVLLLDIDKFKLVNDNYGHAAGDLVLKKVAARIQSILTNRGIVGRLGGDEFVMLLPGVKSPQDVKSIVLQVIEVAGKAINYNEHVLNIEVSLGIALFPGDARSSRELLHRADRAMYQAKRKGGGYAFFSDPLLRNG